MSERPLLRVVRGEPSEEEIGALTAVVAGLADAATAEPPPQRSAWADPAFRLRVPLRPGPTAWRNSARPH